MMQATVAVAVEAQALAGTFEQVQAAPLIPNP
jgi:hypothetical protein